MRGRVVGVLALVTAALVAILSWPSTDGASKSAASPSLVAAPHEPGAHASDHDAGTGAATPAPAPQRVAATGSEDTLAACVVRAVDRAGRPWAGVRVELEWSIPGRSYREQLGRTGDDGRLPVTGLRERLREATGMGPVQECAFEVPCLGMAGPRHACAGGRVHEDEVVLVVPPAGTWRVELRDARGASLAQHVPVSLRWAGHRWGGAEADAAQVPARFEPVALGERWRFEVQSSLAFRKQPVLDSDVPDLGRLADLDDTALERALARLERGTPRFGAADLAGPGFDREEVVHALELDATTPIFSGTVHTAAGEPFAHGELRAHVSFGGEGAHVRTDRAGRFRCAFPPVRVPQELWTMWLDELVQGVATGSRAHRDVSVPVVPGERDLGVWQLEPLPLLVRAVVRRSGGAPVTEPYLIVTPADDTLATAWLTAGPLLFRPLGGGAIAVHGRTSAARILVEAGWSGRLAVGLNRIVPLGTRDLVFDLLSDER